MMYVLANRNSTIIGRSMTVEAAMRSSGNDPASVVNTCSPYGSVRERESEVMYSGQTKEFHDDSAFKSMMVKSDGFAHTEHC